jgi:hypothetical protein
LLRLPDLTDELRQQIGRGIALSEATGAPLVRKSTIAGDDCILVTFNVSLLLPVSSDGHPAQRRMRITATGQHGRACILSRDQEETRSNIRPELEQCLRTWVLEVNVTNSLAYFLLSCVHV